MPTVPYAATWRVVCHQSRIGEEAVNVHHFRWDPTDPTTAEINAIADVYAGFYNLPPTGSSPDRGIRTYRAGSSLLDAVRVYDLRTVPNPAVVERNYTDMVTAAGTAVPSDTAVCITLRTNTGGRSGRGRLYIGPLADTAMVGNVGEPAQVSSQFQQDLVDAYVDLATRLHALEVGFTIDPAVLSLADGVSRGVVSITVDRRTDTQRRRDYGLTFGAPLSSVVP